LLLLRKGSHQLEQSLFQRGLKREKNSCAIVEVLRRRLARSFDLLPPRDTIR